MRFFRTIAVAFAIFNPVIASPGVSPASVSKNVDPGSSFSIEKVVTTPEIPPDPDVVLLVDVTGSMSAAINDIKTNLINVISTVNGVQPNAQFAVVSFGDLADPNGFQVNQGLTNSFSALQAAVNSLRAELGQDTPEDWINALYQLSTGAVTYRAGSSRIIVLVSDAPSHDPSGGHSLGDAINALKSEAIRVIGVNIQNLDQNGQATAVTEATGGTIIGSAADAVSKAIVSGLKNLDVTVTPNVVTCDPDLTVNFDPSETKVTSGDVVTLDETVQVVRTDATQGATLYCSVEFLLNGKSGGPAFVQSLAVTVNKLGCDTCDPRPGKNLCHITTSCTPTPYGTMCLTRPGYKADGAHDDEMAKQWRLKWPVPGHEHRVAVKPGTPSNTLCDSKNTGPNVCKEVILAGCSTGVKSEVDGQYVIGQTVIGQEEL
ncbi:hypothetical protein BX600DRAFT_435527 [Xylariales sp. PMI_506]|nr:hypothetical protein BX600DRAFT_435527 [Xylariales sp. PMI_506]